ncbi:hypothetical protein SATMO3_39960 [Sporomusa aerivorans]
MINFIFLPFRTIVIVINLLLTSLSASCYRVAFYDYLICLDSILDELSNFILYFLY